MKRLLLLCTLWIVGCSATPAVPETVELTPDEPTDVVEELKTGCESDDAASCLSLALRYERGDGVAEDVKAASRLYDKACELNNAHACYGKAMILLYEQNNPVRAHLLFEYTCGAKHWPSCVVLGDIYRDGALNKDEPKALAYYQQACDGGYQLGCNAAISLVWTASDQLIQLDDFVRRLENGCEHRHAPSCEELSKLYADGVRWTGDELIADKAKAEALQRRAGQLERASHAADAFTVEVKVPAGDVVTHEEANSPPKVPFQPGFIVVSGVEGAVIYVDGVETGRKIPAKVLVVKGGPHHVTVQNPDGTLSHEKLVFVRSGKSVEVEF